MPHQPKKKFPPREFGKKKITKCSFQKDWFVAHPWIHYDETRDSTFCHVCVRAYHRNYISDNNIEPRWFSKGYTNWKDATCEGRGFKGHELSKGHKEAVERTLVLPTCTEDVGKTLSREHSAEKSVNRQALPKILSNVRFLAQQALPLRGDKAGEINSNFNQLYYLRAEDNPFLNDWMKRRGDKYTSKDIQNEMIKVMALQVLRELQQKFVVLIFSLSWSMRPPSLQTFDSLHCAGTM